MRVNAVLPGMIDTPMLRRIMGAIFAAIWGYILYLRRDVARRMQAGQLYDQLGHPPGYPPEEQG